MKGIGESINSAVLKRELEKAKKYNEENPQPEPVYKCKKCKDLGVIIHNQFQLDEKTEICDCYYKNQVVMELLKSGLSIEKINTTIEDFNINDKDNEVKSKRSEMKVKASHYIMNKKGWFFINGQTGSGKTMICNIISKYLSERGMKLKYMNWLSEMNNAKQNHNKFDSYEWNKIKTVELLYIDDFVKNQTAKKYGDNDEYYHVLRDVPQFEHDKAMELINYRSERGLMTIISTEYTLDDLESWNGALAGRISEMVKRGGQIVTIPKEDKYNYRKFGKF